METFTFFKDTFKYNYHFNQELILLFEEKEHSIPEKSIELLNHLINAQNIWNHRILNKTSTLTVWEIQDLETLRELNQINYQQSLSILDSIDLNKTIEYKNSQGTAFSNSVQDILFHIINHSTYHRAQIASDLKANGINPINTDYIFYKRK